jgi:hypothetical protein
VAEFSVFYAARFGSDLWFFLFSWFSGVNSGAFFSVLFCSAGRFRFCSLASSSSSSSSCSRP